MDLQNSPAESIYASFGVSDAIISGELTEHEQSMLQLPTNVRDGDDAIITEEEPEEEDLETTEGETDEELLESPDSTEESDEHSESSDDADSTEEQVSQDTPAVSDNLVEATEQLEAHLESTQTLLAEAIEKGLDPAIEAQINEEYASGNGLSDSTYEALADAGYSKAFVDSFVAGQESIAQAFTDSVFNYAGGEESFHKMTSFMSAKMPSAVDAFNDAVDRNDGKTIKFIIDQAKEAMVKTYGKRPAKPIAAKPAKPASKPAVEPFANRDEMIKAMSDNRYRVDHEYRAAVEQRVYASNI